MRRKLISYNAFNTIEKSSLTNAGYELDEASSILADLLECGEVDLNFYDSDNVYYKTADGDYVRANYKIVNNTIQLENIETVVIDESSHAEARKKILGEMVDALSNDEDMKADSLFQHYLNEAAPKMKLMKGGDKKSAVATKVSNAKGNLTEEIAEIWGEGPKDAKRSIAARKGHAKHPFAAKKGHATRKKHGSALKALHNSASWKAAKKKAKDLKKGGLKAVRPKGNRIKEWTQTAFNVLEYCEFLQSTPVLGQSKVVRDDLDNVVAVTIPTSQARNEGKILTIKYNNMKTDFKVLREQAMNLVQDQAFRKAVATVKSHNNISDNAGLTEAVNGLVEKYPAVLYLTERELSKVVSDSLELEGATNYDDKISGFIAEGVLRTAVESYPNRVERIKALAQFNPASATKDAYADFQNVVAKFYPALDEKMTVENKIFEDLYNVLSEIHEIASETNDYQLRKCVEGYASSIDDVADGKRTASVQLAEEVAAFLSLVLESNLEGSSWEITKNPHESETGDHPVLSKYAGQSYSPRGDLKSNDNGPGGMSSDGKSYSGNDFVKTGFASEGDLNFTNPYLLKSLDFRMKNEKGVADDCDNASGQEQGETWPELKNPYLRPEVRVHVSDDNRVDN